DLANKLLQELALIRKENTAITYLRPDAKAQITLEYDDDNKPSKIVTIVLSTQHDEFVQRDAHTNKAEAEKAMQDQIRKDVIEILIPRLLQKYPQYEQYFHDAITYHINPTGVFIIGWTHGDTGLTGRKIIVDTYGGKGAHGGGAFSGKGPSKVDRSAAYATRHIAKNLVAAGVADDILLHVSYAIGIAESMRVFVNTYGTSNVDMTDGTIAQKIQEIWDLRPY